MQEENGDRQTHALHTSFIIILWEIYLDADMTHKLNVPRRWITIDRCYSKQIAFIRTSKKKWWNPFCWIICKYMLFAIALQSMRACWFVTHIQQNAQLQKNEARENRASATNSLNKTRINSKWCYLFTKYTAHKFNVIINNKISRSVRVRGTHKYTRINEPWVLFYLSQRRILPQAPKERHLKLLYMLNAVRNFRKHSESKNRNRKMQKLCRSNTISIAVRCLPAGCWGSAMLCTA